MKKQRINAHVATFTDIASLLRWWIQTIAPRALEFENGPEHRTIRFGSPALSQGLHKEWEVGALVRTTRDGAFQVVPIAEVRSGSEEVPIYASMQIECSPLSPWTFFEDCLRAVIHGDDSHALVARVARLIAIAVCTESLAATCRQIYVMLVLKWLKFDDSDNTGTMLRAVTSVTPPIYLDHRRTDVFVHDRVSDAFIRISDGCEFRRPSPEWSLLHCVIVGSKHRNATRKKDCFVIECPQSYALARQIVPCQTCMTTMCIALMCPMSSGRCFITLADFRAIVPQLAANKFDTMVARGRVDVIAAQDSATLFHLNRSPEVTIRATVDRIINERIANMRASGHCVTPQTMDKIAQESQKLAQIVTRRLTVDVPRAFARCYGVSSIASLVHPHLMTHALECNRVFADAAIEIDVPHTTQTLFIPSATTAVADLPGIAELAAANWNIAALMKRLPPCLAKIVYDSTHDRHPSYVERMLIGSFLCRISGLLSDPSGGFYETWQSLFRHPEPGCCLYNAANIANALKVSRYGKACVKDVQSCFERGRKFGCAFAIKRGSCPFAFEAERAASEFKKLYERVPARDESDPTPRSACLRFLRLEYRVETPLTATESPAWFFAMAKQSHSSVT
jgi:hypothetical protein